MNDPIDRALVAAPVGAVRAVDRSHSRRNALRLALLAIAGWPAFPAGAGAAQALTLADLARPGRVLMLRHASAPGTGDPAGFRVGDCATQRNLDEAGREQARRIGRRIAAAGVSRARVWSSQWCRCLETARLLGLGPVTELPLLNSFFGRPEERDARVAALRHFLAGLPADGPPVVLVTHQVMVTGFTGRGVASGSGALLQLDGSGEARVLGDVATE